MPNMLNVNLHHNTRSETAEGIPNTREKRVTKRNRRFVYGASE